MNKLLLYILLVIIMILFAHMIDKKNEVKIKMNREGFIGNEYIGSVVRLKVNLPMLGIHTNGVSDTNENTTNKFFYLACVKLNPNCNVVNVNNSCVPIFIDKKQCNNNSLGIESNKDTYRLVLIHESQIDMPDLSDTCNFVFQKVNDKIYLKNIQNNHYPKLFTNDVFVPVIGTANDINKNNNILCGDMGAGGKGGKGGAGAGAIGVYNLDGNTYLLSTTDSKTSSPVKLTFKKDDGGYTGGNGGGNGGGSGGSGEVVTIQLEKYDEYGQAYDYYDLIYTNDVETSSIYTLNTVSIDNYIKRDFPSNTLHFKPEIITKSPEYIKSNYIKSV
jgi:hypothetical protein